MVKDYVYESSCHDRADARPDPPPWDRKALPDPRHESSRILRREAFYLWMFIAQEGLLEEAREFMDENMDHPVPSEYWTRP